MLFLGGNRPIPVHWEKIDDRRNQLNSYEVGERGVLRQVGSLAQPDIKAWWYDYDGIIHDGSLLCEASSFNGFVEIDIRNPARMTKIEYAAEHDFASWAFDTDRRVIYGITNDWEDQQFNDGIMRLDISNPQNPFERERVENGHAFSNLIYENGRLYMSEHGNILIYDVSNIADFRFIGSIDEEEYIVPELVRDQKLVGVTYTTDENGNSNGYRLKVWNVSNPDSAFGIGYCLRGGRYGDGTGVKLLLRDNLLILNDIYSVNFYDISRALSVPDLPLTPYTFHLSPAYPNPFNAITTLRFSLPGDSWVRIVVYDLSGREVAILVDGEVRAGNHATQWNAEGFATGIYLVRMETPSFSTTRKMMLVK